MNWTTELKKLPKVQPGETEMEKWKMKKRLRDTENRIKCQKDKENVGEAIHKKVWLILFQNCAIIYDEM